VPDPTFTPAQIRHYYDRNTPAFVRLGHGRDVGAIHRAVWGPGVSDRTAAFRYVEDRIAELIASMFGDGTGCHVLDLGCGIGASLTYLAQRLPIRGTGVTISPVQARIGEARIRSFGLEERVRVLEGDYTALPAGIPPVDLAYAIESFVHGPSPERFFAEASRVIRPGGVLVICDDMRRVSTDARAVMTVEQFVRGWHVNSLLTAEQLNGIAASSGFDHASTTELTPWLELDRPRDRAIAVLARLAAALPVVSTRMAPLVGGSALQTGLKRGWIAYDLAVFRRV
jgi:tocopherol O-methyltransferase